MKNGQQMNPFVTLDRIFHIALRVAMTLSVVVVVGTIGYLSLLH